MIGIRGLEWACVCSALNFMTHSPKFNDQGIELKVTTGVARGGQGDNTHSYQKQTQISHFCL
jgi:hypothetical protein